jgi:PAS domain S-box-containing protein
MTRMRTRGRAALGTRTRGVSQTTQSQTASTAFNGELDVRDVMDAAPVMIWVSGEDKGCVWFNKPWLVFTGRSLAEELGNGWSEGVHPADFDRCMKIYVSHFDARKGFRMQYRLRRRDGAYRWIDDQGIPRYSRDGAFLGYIGSCIDIHEHREVQFKLRELLLEIAELNRQADAAMLSASIAHEINQPLAGIVLNGTAGLRWLTRKTPDIEKAKVSLNTIIRAGERAAEIVNSIRAVSRKGHRVYYEAVNLNETIQGVLALIEVELQRHHIRVETELNASPSTILGDRIQLQQVILNLINNSTEAMAAVANDLRILHLRTEHDRAKGIMISVQDSGPGIHAHDVERVFERFFTTKSEGMGMGLSICRAIVEAHGGRVWAESGGRGGSIFRISLPAAPP